MSHCYFLSQTFNDCSFWRGNLLMIITIKKLKYAYFHGEKKKGWRRVDKSVNGLHGRNQREAGPV